MSSPNDRVGEYARIDDKETDFDSEAGTLIPDTGSSRQKRTQSRIWKLSKVSLWVVQILLLLANTYGLTMVKAKVDRDKFLNPMRGPIQYKTVTMFDERATAPYKAVNGSSTSEVDHQWNKLLDIGAVKMDRAAKDRLPKDTAQVYDEDLYAGILEFEHQLHCLNRIRKVFYGSTVEEMGGTTAIFASHNDHCFQYLRQTIMCHADIEIMSMTREPEVRGYIPDFDTVRQCRDFDLIHEWARGLPDVDQDAIDGSRDPVANSHRPHAGDGS